MTKGNKITIGEWAWDPDLVLGKIKSGKADECWGWSGAQSPHSNLVGARKNGRAQMTQAARLIWMTQTGQDVADLEVRHTCGNRFCTNFKHMFTRPNHMHYHQDGRPLGMPKPKLPPPPAKKFIQVDLVKPREKRQPWWQL